MSRKSYSQKLADPRWQKKRLEVFQRDDFTCRDCGATDKQLHVHHCYYQNGNPWDTDERFLLTLCADCHEDRQGLEYDAKISIGGLFALMDKDNLKNFTTTAVHALIECEKLDEPALYVPEIREQTEIEYLSDIRWWNEAYENKKSRVCYENVTGRKPNWPKR